MDAHAKLTTLEFESIDKFNIIMAQRIKSVLPNLQDLKLKGCYKVESAAVEYVLSNFQTLERLMLNGCELSPELRQLKRPKLEFL
jgi:hypothetical protein